MRMDSIGSGVTSATPFSPLAPGSSSALAANSNAVDAAGWMLSGAGAPPIPPANGNQVSPAMIAATLGMGDFLDPPDRAASGSGGRGEGAGGTATASAASSATGIPREVLDRVGLVFDHDGGYSYRITSEGYFEIVKAPEDRGIGYELTPTGEFASAWRTLADFIVAMGPAAGAPAGDDEAGPSTPGAGATPSYGPWPGAPSEEPRGGPRHRPHRPRHGAGRPGAPGEPTTDNRPARPSSPGAQMASLLAAARAGHGEMHKRCYHYVKGYIKDCGGYGDILDIYADERFAGFGDYALEFADAVNANGAAALGLEEVGGLPMNAPPGTILVIKGNGQVNLSEEWGDISVIEGVSGGCVVCYNDGRMLLDGDPSEWTSGRYRGVLVAMYQPIARR